MGLLDGQQLMNAQALQGQLAAIPAPTLGPIDLGGSGGPPPIPAPSLTPAAPNQVLTDQDKLNTLRNSGPGWSQIHNPWLRGAAEAGDIGLRLAGSVFAPAHVLEAALPGTTLNHHYQVGQAQQNLANDQAVQDKQAQTDDQRAQTQQREAQADAQKALAEKYGTQADAAHPITLTPEQATAAGVPELAGVSVSQPTYEKLFGTTANNDTKQTVAAGHDQTRVTTTGMNNDTSRANNTATNTNRESIADAANKTRTLIAQMHDATSQANNQNTNNHKGQAGAGGAFKVPADVTKRAALASNVTENADAVDALLQRNPNIVGRAGGRYSTVQQMIGSDDPDIAELGVRMHNIALASNGAHGVRAAQAIAQTENELFHNFTSGPNAIHSALNATRGSMKTFLDDEANYQQSGHRTGGGDAPPAGAKVRDYTNLGNK